MAMELKHLNPQHVMDVTGKAIDEISRLRAENAELKAKLESEKESRYADSVDAGMRERRLRRALWIARAEIAHKKIDEYWPDYCHNAHSRIDLLKWEEVERKCRAKAEEYK